MTSTKGDEIMSYQMGILATEDVKNKKVKCESCLLVDKTRNRKLDIKAIPIREEDSLLGIELPATAKGVPS